MMKITISGDIGSGKSTVGKLVAKELDLPYYSTGQIQRKIAEEMGLDTLQLNLLAEQQTEIDDKIDGFTINLEKEDKPCLVDSRLAWNFVPSSLKVYLACEVEEAARRIYGDTERTGEVSSQNSEELVGKINARRASEVRRFETKYSVSINDHSNFDLIVDTTDCSPEEAAAEIVKTAREKWK